MLDCIDAGELQGVLYTMSKEGKWDEMGTLITDDILNKFAVVGEPEDIAAERSRRFGGLVDRVSSAYGTVPKAVQKDIIADLRAA